MPDLAASALPLMPRGLVERLICLHDEIKAIDHLSPLSRIAVALYDETTDILKTFIHSSDGDSPLDHSVAKLVDLPSLQQLAWTGARRVINDMSVPAKAGQPQAERLVASGYLSSYTVPISHKGVFYGFLFLNSFERGFFTPEIVHQLRPYAELITMIVMRELDAVRMMQAAVKVIREVSSARDSETAIHLARMAHYARLIASKLAAKYNFSDEFVEFLFQFCPLHDVGKVAVPDSILLKPGRLTDDEMTVMRSHVARGVQIVDLMMRDFGLGSMPHFNMLRTVVAYHHEAMDGSGYPYNLVGTDIPLESRIAAVADVFDALTSTRPYKAAWSNDEALALLHREAGVKFDSDCVGVLVENLDSILEIQSQFSETVFD